MYSIGVHPRQLHLFKFLDPPVRMSILTHGTAMRGEIPEVRPRAVSDAPGHRGHDPDPPLGQPDAAWTRS